MPSLPALYRANGYFVREASGCWLVGFKPGAVSFIVKEVHGSEPVGETEAERLYAELQAVGETYGCRHYRVVAYAGYTEAALAFELHGLAFSDASYLKSLASGRHVELFSHNEAAYRAIEKGFARHRIGAVVQATGTGKSFLIARYLAEHADERILVIAPNITILEEIRRAVEGNGRPSPAQEQRTESRPETEGMSRAEGMPRAGSIPKTGKMPRVGDVSEETIASILPSLPAPQGNIFYRTFQSLVRARERSAPLQVDHILIDEFHHFGAEVWGEAVREVIEANPEARVLGTSATPVRPEGMIDTVDVYFEGNLFHELTLPEAWYYGILPVPVLVQSVYGLNGQLDKLQRTLDRLECSEARRRRIQRKLDAARVDFSASLGATELIRRFLPPAVRKLLVFCRDKEDLKQMQPQVMEWLEKAGFPADSFEVHNDRSERENLETLKAFRRDTGRLHVLFSINMLIEGLHVEGVDAALFLRRTESYVVTLQQLGRCLKAGAKQRPVILDLVNNLSGKSVYDVLATDMERMQAIRSPKTFRGISDFEVTGFFSDIRLRVEEILSELEPWEIMYERLADYHTREKDWPSAGEGKLGLWCHTQRIARKRGSLAADRVARLDALGFTWEYHDSQWTKQYERLKTFYAETGRWPKRGEGSLSTWCNTQRQARKNGRLTKERIRRLDALGFVWEYDPDKEWKAQYEALKAFREKKGRWPKTTEGGSLGAWCVTQRKLRREGKLAADRQARLEAIGFTWSADGVWTEHFRRLEAFYRAEGRWPTSREGTLGNWCSVQKRLFRQGELLPEREKKLRALGFPL